MGRDSRERKDDREMGDCRGGCSGLEEEAGKDGLCVDDRAVGERRKMRAGLLLSRLQGEPKEVRGWSWLFG